MHCYRWIKKVTLRNSLMLAWVMGIYGGILVAEANAPWKVVGLVSSMTRKVALAEAGTASSGKSRRVWVHVTKSASDAVLT